MKQSFPDVVHNILAAANRRVAAARAAGGIPLYDIVSQNIQPPKDHWYDPLTEFYIPNNVELLPIPADLTRDIMDVSSHG